MGLIVVLEHRVQAVKESKIIQKLAPGWAWLTNGSRSNKSRIWILWNQTIIDFSLLSMSTQSMHGTIRILNTYTQFQLTVVYGLHTIQDRGGMWEDLRSICQSQQGPWLIMGDFNTILTATDKQNGSPVQERDVRDVKEMLFDTGLTEMQTIGTDYTWTNNTIYSKIDRVLVNAAWMNRWPNVYAMAMEPYFSGHSPLRVCVEANQVKHGKPFRFFNCLAEHKEFLPLVQAAWQHNDKAIMYTVWQLLKEVKHKLKVLNKKKYCSVDNTLEDIRQQLHDLQESMGPNLPQSSMIKAEKKFRGKLEKWGTIRESIYK
ncbi:uncharacterized protein LOC132619616 [Lycium barbarum]|uniref:uncharacterized protein LOC132619616 n=1 Tax=Lycium barbarum TaxID=112863 RepID=UPI00293F08EA|nr:uncharacterized protein LOC132619616 [Lycium barbarum]